MPEPLPEPERKLTISLPSSVLRQLKERALGCETTARALVLEALAAAGYRIPADEIRDRRRGDGHGTSFTNAPAPRDGGRL